MAIRRPAQSPTEPSGSRPVGCARARARVAVIALARPRPVHGTTAGGDLVHPSTYPLVSAGTVVCVHGALDGGASFAGSADASGTSTSSSTTDGGTGRHEEPRWCRDSRSTSTTRSRSSRPHAVRPAVGRPSSSGTASGGSSHWVSPRGVPGVIDGVVAYEAPFPWGRARFDDAVTAQSPDGGVAAEAFFRRIVGDAAWEHLSDLEREARRLDGTALLEDLAVLQGAAPFDPRTSRCPWWSGSPTAPQRAVRPPRTRSWPAALRATLTVFPKAGHGAHLLSPTQLRGRHHRCTRGRRRLTGGPSTDAVGRFRPMRAGPPWRAGSC